MGVYNATTGATINATFIGGTATIYGLAIKPVAAPVVSVSAKKKIRTTKSVRRIKGHSTDAERVLVKVRSASYKPAKGTTSWSYRAKLKKGTHRVTIQAINSEGVSSYAKMKIIRTSR